MSQTTGDDAGSTPQVYVFERVPGDWWAECLVCNTWLSTSNASKHDAEQSFARHAEHDHSS